MNVVFDLDGTLIDSLPDIHATANAVLTEIGAPLLTEAQSRGFVGKGVAVFVQRARAALGIPDRLQEPMVAAFLARYEIAHDLTQPYPNVRDALARLSGHALAICTNKPLAPTRAVLDHLDLATPFCWVVGGDSLPVRKPDPAPLLHCLDQMPKGPACFVGDSEVDAETAERAGVPFLLFTEGYRKTPVSALPHTAAFCDFSALPDLVASLSQ